MAEHWTIKTDDAVSYFEVIPVNPNLRYDFDKATTYPIGTALPIVFDNLDEACRCVIWLERLVGRLTMASKVMPTTVNNYQPMDANNIAQMVIDRLDKAMEGRR